MASDFPDAAPVNASAQDPVLAAGTALWLLQMVFNNGGATPDGLKGFAASLAENEIEDAVYRLLPLSADHLETVVAGDALKSRLKGIQRLTWYKNQLQLSGLPCLLGEFQSAGISTILLGDAASELLLYEKRFIRPVDELALLIDPGEVCAGFDLLRRNGWKPQPDLPGRNIGHIPGQRFVKEPENRALELRWHVLSTCCYPNADLDFWKMAQPMTLEGMVTQTLNATDLLLYLAVRVFNSERSHRVLLIADALKVLQNKQTEIDWERLLVQAKSHGVVVPLRTLLNFLGLNFDINLPAPIVGRLEQMPFSMMERFEARYRRHRPDQRLLGDFPLLYFDYLRDARIQKKNGRTSGFGTYLKAYWQVGSNRELLQLMVLLSQRRIRSKLSGTRPAILKKAHVNDS